MTECKDYFYPIFSWTKFIQAQGKLSNNDNRNLVQIMTNFDKQENKTVKPKVVPYVESMQVP